jgi:ElaB/YqjD/DUF883 family membrane-anchored ribosome-binding protein
VQPAHAGTTRKGEVMTEATDTGQQEGLAGQASAKVEDAASAAQEKASELREQGSARLRDQFDQRSAEAGSQVRALADALRRSVDELSNEGSSGASQLTRQAADRIEQVGTYLEETRGEELMRDVESFARRRPWMIVGLGVLVGVAAARFVKASSERRHGQYGRSSQQWPSRPGVADPVGSGFGPQELSSGRGEPGTAAAGMPRPRTDEPLRRDPYAETR